MRFASFSVVALLVLAVGCGSDDDHQAQATASGGQTQVGGAGGGTKASTTAAVGGSSSVATTNATTAVGNLTGGAAATGGAMNATGGSNAGGTQATSAATSTAGQSSVLGTGGTTIASTTLASTGGATVANSTLATGGTTQSLLPVGGATSVGGSEATTGVGGNSSTAVSTGGTSTVDASTGGTSAADTSTGGTSAADTATGGTSAVDTGVGGTSSAGGTETGGTSSSGGADTGGTSAVGGTTATGGTSGTGGTSATSTIPTDWKCDATHYGTHDGCDCGCGVVDPDCENAISVVCTVSSSHLCCDTYLQAGSCVEAINTPWPYSAINPDDNSKCLTAPPNNWTCAVNAYGDGMCDCGCGAIDSDCSDPVTCDSCRKTGSCASSETGCEIVNANHPERCDLVVPTGWHCPQRYYGDDYCDCGCGAPDPDCANDVADCGCGYGSCSPDDCSAIDPDDLAVCLNWSCDLTHQNDGICDCGCGDDGSDCKTTTGIAVCSTCANPGSCASSCNDVDPANNTTCKK